ncbi:MAG: DUF3127 domain-containing protein [Bacteroidaceae bacterium]|jgi:hypothetical protein
MELTGKVIAVLPLQSGTSNRNGNEWRKQDYVIETVNEQYPRRLCFNLWGDRIDQFKIQMGELITVSFDIDAREYNGRWYNDIRAWKIDRVSATPAAPAAAAPGMPGEGISPIPPASAATPDFSSTEGSDDDLPF